MDRIHNPLQRYQTMFGTTAAGVATFLLFVFTFVGVFGLIDAFAGG